MRRRQFLSLAPVAGALALRPSYFPFGKRRFRLAFSTLGCPGWSLEQTLRFAAENGYSAIELRGVQGQLDLPKHPDLSTPERVALIKSVAAERGIRILNLGASAQLHHDDPEKRAAHLGEAKRFIELAGALGCPFVRVFPNELPKDRDENATLELIAKGLVELGDFARPHRVKVLLESHGQVVDSDRLERLMKTANHPQVGLLWDVFNMWSVGGEAPESVYARLKKYIWHVHLKDAVFTAGKSAYVLTGEGTVPLRAAVKALHKGGYKGYYSFEWEKMWHKDLWEPEVALPHFVKAFKEKLR